MRLNKLDELNELNELNQLDRLTGESQANGQDGSSEHGEEIPPMDSCIAPLNGTGAPGFSLSSKAMAFPQVAAGSGGACPGGHLTVAQRFNAGWEQPNLASPGGTAENIPRDSTVPPGLAAPRRADPSVETTLKRWAILGCAFGKSQTARHTSVV